MKSRSYLLLSIMLVVILVLSNSCAKKYELNISDSAGGSVTMNPSGGSYKEGERIILAASPDSGFAFTGWGDIQGISADYSTDREIEIIMPPQNTDISAVFSVPNKGWTFMVYMAGDNSLSSQVSLDINEMEKGLYDAVAGGNSQIDGVVRVVVLADRGGSGDTVIYLVEPDNSSYTISSPKLTAEFNSKGELNMGDPQTLKNFITWSQAVFPSEHSALILWNHGGGVKSLDTGSVSKEICEDDGDILFMNEVQSAIASAVGSSRLDVIGFDACIMGEVETAYEMRDLTDYFVASMALEWGNGWGYHELFRHFTSVSTPPTPAQAVDILVQQYRDSTLGISKSHPNTMTAVSTTGLDELKNQIDLLAKYMDADGSLPTVKSRFESARDDSVYYYTYGSDASIQNSPYHDLYSLCEQIEASSFSQTVKDQAAAVRSSLASAVAAAYGSSVDWDLNNGTVPDLGLDYYSTDNTSAVRGLSIFVSHSSAHYANQFWYTDQAVQATSDGGVTIFDIGQLDFCTANTSPEVNTWKGFFDKVYGGY